MTTENNELNQSEKDLPQTVPQTQSTTKSVLDALNDAKFSRFHVKAIAVAGVGFFTDAYDLFIINLVVPMIAITYFNGHIPVLEESFLKGSAVVGTLLGQLAFGIGGDLLGRKKIYGLELALMILGTFGSAIAANTVRGIGVVVMISFWRFILGLGIGGDYPLSAVITSEYANVSKRGMMISLVFAMQGVGILTAGIVSIIIVRSFKTMIEDDPLNVDYCWRLCLGLGCIPAAVAVYFRTTLPESPRYTLEVEGNTQKSVEGVSAFTGEKDVSVAAGGDVKNEIKPASLKDFGVHFSQWKNLKILLGTSLCWFFLDVAFYGLGLNQTIVLEAIGYSKHDSTYDNLYSLAVGNTIISLCGTVPGYFVTVALIERMGRIKIQLLGFGVLTVIFVILAAGFDTIKAKSVPLFIVLYCIGLFMFTFGPNTTTFVIPGEVFPTRYRSTGHGIAAGSGKLGAILASYGFAPLSKHENGVRNVIAIFSVFMFLGFLATFLLPETKGRTLEDLSNDFEETSCGCEDSKHTESCAKGTKVNRTDLVSLP